MITHFEGFYFAFIFCLSAFSFFAVAGMAKPVVICTVWRVSLFTVKIAGIRDESPGRPNQYLQRTKIMHSDLVQWLLRFFIFIL